MVGYLEYSSALRLFDQFVQRASPEELAGANEIISTRDEFAVYSGLSNRLASDGPRLMTVNDPQGTNFERRGLPWVMALARLELGGILATFTTVSRPFDAVKPTLVEREAYAELLLDGAQTHFDAFANDGQARQVAQSIPGTEMLAYIRRLSVSRHMLNAGVRAAGNRLTPDQQAAAMAQDRLLGNVQGLYTGIVQEYIARSRSTQVSSLTVATNRETWLGCSQMIKGAMSELENGTASMREIK